MIQGRNQALDGDRTTTGAICFASGTGFKGYGREALRLYDKTSACPLCGEIGTLVEGVRNFVIHGRQAVVDGALVACACPAGTNRIIASAVAGERSASPEVSKVNEKSGAVHSRLNSSSEMAIYVENSTSATCSDPDLMGRVASYIAAEMNRNIRHSSVLKMKQLSEFDAAKAELEFEQLPWYARLFSPDFRAKQLGNRAAVMALWAERVGQNRPWDHKPEIARNFGGAWQKQGRYDYFYDIWSNIHYGYVGRAGGLTESVLLDGAGLEQVASDSIRKLQKWSERGGPRRTADVEGLRAWDDIADRVSIGIGVKLYEKLPDGGVTAKILMDEILAVPRSKWGEGIRDHVCN